MRAGAVLMRATLGINPRDVKEQVQRVRGGVSGKRSLYLTPLDATGDELLQYICQENNQYGVETLPGGLPAPDTANGGRR